ncbi:Abi-alpha family protein [Mesorhizobium loti]|uniref:Abi-alpha family protein n=1 Tax=Rhizobium loti TaxID=381 RepID=UPI0004BB67E8|nr:Abi-alpha family protein [Mesorhizobium loti]
MSESSKGGPLLPGGEIDKAAADLLRQMLGGPATAIGNSLADGWGGLVGDRLREWRTRNFANGLHKTAEHLKRMGVSFNKMKALPGGEMYELFENLSKQDDPLLSELWASLTANALTPDNGISAERGFTEALKNLGPAEARLLKYLFDLASEYDRVFAAQRSIGDGQSTITEAQHELLYGAYHEKRIEMGRELIKNIDRQRLPHSISAVISLGLVTVIPDRGQRIGARVEMHSSLAAIDSDELERQLAQIRNLAAGISPKPNELALKVMQTAVANHHSLFIETPIQLSDFGKRLMYACHQTAETPSKNSAN